MADRANKTNTWNQCSNTVSHKTVLPNCFHKNCPQIHNLPWKSINFSAIHIYNARDADNDSTSQARHVLPVDIKSRWRPDLLHRWKKERLGNKRLQKYPKDNKSDYDLKDHWETGITSAAILLCRSFSVTSFASVPSTGSTQLNSSFSLHLL